LKTICLVRHGEAAPEKSDMQDIDRPLTKTGIKDIERVAKKLAKSKKIPDLLITSSAQRALHTAALFAERFGCSTESLVIESALYDQENTDILFDMLAKLDNQVSRVMVVGHHPMLTDFATLLLRSVHTTLPAGGVVGIEIDIKEWPQVLNLRGYSTFSISPTEKLSDKKLDKRLRAAVAATIQNRIAESLAQLDAETAAAIAKTIKKNSKKTARQFVRHLQDGMRKQRLLQMDLN